MWPYLNNQDNRLGLNCYLNISYLIKMRCTVEFIVLSDPHQLLVYPEFVFVEVGFAIKSVDLLYDFYIKSNLKYLYCFSKMSRIS